MHSNRQLALINQLDAAFGGGLLTPEIRKMLVHLRVSPTSQNNLTADFHRLTKRCVGRPKGGPEQGDVFLAASMDGFTPSRKGNNDLLLHGGPENK